MIDVVLWVLIGGLLLLGLAGTLVPFLPGTPLIVVAALVHGIAYDWVPMTPWRLALLAALSAAGYVLHYVAGGLGARRAGGSMWAVAGALVGGVIGIFFGIPGLLLGPPLGAIGGELMRGGDVAMSVRAGLAAFVGMVAGAMANFALAVVMIGLLLWWVARG